MSKPTPTRLFLWADCGVFAGGGDSSKMHAHHAIQITYVLDGQCRIRAEADTDWRTSTGFVILPGAMYQAEVPGRYLTFFIDVNHPLYWRHKHAQPGRYQNGVRDFRWGEALAEDRRRFHSLTISCADARAMLQDEVNMEFPAQEDAAGLDGRIDKIVAYIDERLPQAARIDEICEVAHLSESRVMHLFRSETGTTVRQYILWRRLKLALLAIAKGMKVTESAHVAGFADAAHLTRTFVTMFGFSPTEILAGPVQSEFVLCR